MMTDPLRQYGEDQILRSGGAPLVDEALEEVAARPDMAFRRVSRQEQLDALRDDVARLRAELMAIAAGTSRLAVIEAAVVLETVENGIRRHLAPVLIAAAATGYIWSAFARRR